MQQSRIHDRVLYSKDVMRGNSPEYARRFETQISDNLGEVAGRLREAAGAISESAAGKRDRALERARELVQGLESLRARGQESGGRGQGGAQDGRSGGQSDGRTQAGQPGGVANGDPNSPGNGRLDPRSGAQRQFSREFRLRREAAESLRRELAQQGGVELGELDRAITGLRQLESGGGGGRRGDPRGIDALQAAVIEGLRTWEFKLFRALTQSGDNRPALGAPSQAPAEYRALVEEYYRSLARTKKP